MKFIWKNEYSVRIKIIDEQHKKFFDIVNRIYSLLELPEVTDQNLFDIITELKNYALYHLDYEEKLLAENNYPELALHKTFHKLYKDEIKNLMQKAQAVKDSDELKKLVMEISDFCQSWLYQHMKTADQMYSSYMVSKGLE